MVVLKELTQILGLFRQPARQARTGAGPPDRAPARPAGAPPYSAPQGEELQALADEIRNRLAALGVVLEDRPDGTPGGSSRAAERAGSRRRPVTQPVCGDPTVQGGTRSMATTANVRRADDATSASRRPGPGARDRPRPERDRLRGGRAVARGPVRRRGGGDPPAARAKATWATRLEVLHRGDPRGPRRLPAVGPGPGAGPQPRASTPGRRS